MATQMKSTRRPNRARANSHSQNAKAQPEIDSSVVIKEIRQDVEPLTDEQRRELIATIWREMYGPSPCRLDKQPGSPQGLGLKLVP
jgi:hypothetical protein